MSLLQDLYLTRIEFPGLPKLLLSVTHLVRLTLWDIPHSGYFSPEAMVTCLSVLTRLEKLRIDCCVRRTPKELMQIEWPKRGFQIPWKGRRVVDGETEHCRVGRKLSYDHELSWELVN